MIALIKFDDDLVIERSEAEKLGLSYEDKERFGRSMSYRNDIKPMSNGDYYVDELFKQTDENDKIKYYKDENCTNECSEYYRYERLENKDWVFVKAENNLVDLNTFALNCRLPYRITKTIKSEEPTVQNINYIMQEMEEKFTRINKVVDTIKNQQLNEKVNVHVGGGLIVTYNELKLLEDSCTDMLQTSLNEGWRIIAVCVQPDQRRPDYVLGRYNSNLDMHQDALRR